MIQIEMKKEELMNHLEEEMNRSWEEIFASLKECQACIVTEEEPLESKEEY